MDNTYLTVSALTKYIKYRFESDQHLISVYLKGEISNFKKHSRGHFYFTIKDEGAQISAVMFASSANKLLFTPKEGMKILVQGRISVYEATGNYQIYVETLIEDGLGSLYLAYEELKKQLESEGYFKDQFKKSIPKFPLAIGVITSPTGAVIRDIINTVRRRYPLTKIILYPALVQGSDAKDSIADQIIKANAQAKCDVLIVGRGGGSIEDLWPFNERIVAEAIFSSKIPIISAVGHETDYTISDYVADMRSPTPTAAAEMATPSIEYLLLEIKNHERNMQSILNKKFEEYKVRLAHIDQLLEYYGPAKKVKQYIEHYKKNIYQLNYQMQNIINFKLMQFLNINQRIKDIDLEDILKNKQEKITELTYKMNGNYQMIYNTKKTNFNVLIAKLSNLNPLMILKRGYSVTKKNDQLIKSIKDVKDQDEINITLSDGTIKAVVKGE